MVDFFNKLFSDTKYISEKKVRNPFFITYLIVLTYRNWEVVFTFFNFDDDCILNDRLFIIKQYFKDKVLWNEILWNLWFTFLVLISSYILFFVFRFISNLFERKIFPIADKIDNNLIVTKERFDLIKSKNDKFYKTINEQRDNINELGDKYSSLLQDYKAVKWDRNKYQKLADDIKKGTEENIKKLNSENYKISKKNEFFKQFLTNVIYEIHIEFYYNSDIKDFPKYFDYFNGDLNEIPLNIFETLGKFKLISEDALNKKGIVLYNLYRNKGYLDLDEKSVKKYISEILDDELNFN